MIEIPNYKIGRLAGRGGVAEVYLARHTLLDRRVAIKIISPGSRGDEDNKRFLKEARVVAGLRHPNIVSIYDVGMLDSKYYIIMEYLDGGNLKQLVKKEMPVSRSLQILRQVASALAHAHDKGFIHRDIKSQNIMFRRDGTPVLTDFGIVKDLSADTGCTIDGTSLGTPHYMSPEQAQGSSKIDWRTDLYSLGVTFYEMLTGSVPYEADSAVAVALKHIQDPLPKLTEGLARYQFIIDRLMAKKPGKRFQSAHELLNALNNLPDTPEQQQEQPPARNAVPQPGEGTAENISQSLLRKRKSLPRKLAYPAAVILLAGGLAAAAAFFLPVDRLLHKEPAAPVQTGTQEPEDLSGQEIDLAAPLLIRALSRGDYQDAEKHIRRIRKEMPAPEDKMLKEAGKFLEKGELGNAGDVYNALLSVEPQNRPALLGLLAVTVKKQQKLAGRGKASFVQYKSHLAFLEKSFTNTDSVYFRQLRINTLERLHGAARRLYDEGSFSQALAHARLGLEHGPNNLRLKKLALLCQARISRNAGRLTEPGNENALAFYNQVLDLDPDDKDARKGIADIRASLMEKSRAAYKNKNYDQALESIEAARSVNPGEERQEAKTEAELLEWRIRGDRLYKQGRYLAPEKENAGYYYKKILKHRPENREVALRLARARVLGPLSAIDKDAALEEQIPAFRKAFQALHAAVSEHGARAVADVRASVVNKIKTAVEARQDKGREIPDAFINLVASHFPELNSIFNTHYDILIARADNIDNRGDRARYYLRALSFDPGRSAAREKIEELSREMTGAGAFNEASDLLDKALDNAPDYSGFKEQLRYIRKARDTRADLFTRLYRIQLVEPFSKKTAAYRDFFENLDQAVNTYGSQEMADALREAKEQIRTLVAVRKAENRLMPEEFIELVADRFPDLEKTVINAQYDILLNKAARSESEDKKAEHYLAALRLNPNRPGASGAVRELARELEEKGNRQRAASILEQARAAAPSDGMIADLYDKIHWEASIYPTDAGCGGENRISRAPVEVQSLNLCLEYQNLDAGSLVRIALSGQDGGTLEVPLVLDASAGSRVVSVSAPVAGFETGVYEITITQGDCILAESRIQFIPRRR
ncbi:MAG: protein kinase [Desulfosalsimonadaceae bacterium]